LVSTKVFLLKSVTSEKHMALSRDKKNQVVAEVSELLANSKLTVVARYQGTSVKSMQQLRRQARENGTGVRVIKNRLFKQVLAGNDKFKDLDTDMLSGQLLYAFNADDDVAPAQSLAQFAKQEPQIEFVGGLSGDGQLLGAEDIKVLAALPTKEQLRGQLVGVIASPLSGLVGVMNANLRGVLTVLDARADQIS
jgi:large subunit ribosomal protein L10